MKNKLETALGDLKRREKSTFAFNVQNFYQLEACAKSANKLSVPVIIQFSERFLRFLDEKYSVHYIISKYKTQYTYFHLDHCIDLDFIKFCIDSGFDSVMFDGSAMSLEENIKNTNIVVEYAKRKGCLVEGELGKVSGVEDGFGEEGSSYAELREILRYVEETKIDLMALGIGNAHGFYENLEGLNISIMKDASEKLPSNQFFVLHGGTGLPEEILRESISLGVVKINISTQLKKCTMDLINEYAAQNELYNEITYHEHMTKGMSALFESYLKKYTI